MVWAAVYGYSIQFVRKLGLSNQNTQIEYSLLPCFLYAVLYGLLPPTLARTCLATPPILLTLSHRGCPPAVHTSAAPKHILGHCSWQWPCPQPKVVTQWNSTVKGVGQCELGHVNGINTHNRDEMSVACDVLTRHVASMQLAAFGLSGRRDIESPDTETITPRTVKMFSFHSGHVHSINLCFHIGSIIMYLLMI